MSLLLYQVHSLIVSSLVRMVPIIVINMMFVMMTMMMVMMKR